jgi:hypothetical protein
MAEHIPHYSGGGPILSPVATAAIAGGQVVEVTGNMTVGPAGAGSIKAIGVAGRDAAIGAGTPVFTDGVHDLTASGAIAAGDRVVCAAAGAVATIGAGTAFQVIGIALEAIADAAKGRIRISGPGLG